MPGGELCLGCHGHPLAAEEITAFLYMGIGYPPSSFIDECCNYVFPEELDCFLGVEIAGRLSSFTLQNEFSIVF